MNHYILNLLQEKAENNRLTLDEIRRAVKRGDISYEDGLSLAEYILNC